MPAMNMMPGGSTLQIPLDAPTSFSATAGNAQVSLTWTDPKDKYATPEGETAQDPDQLVSKWAYTRIARKVGSQPTGPNDGTTVLESAVRNQYQTEPFVDTGLQNEVTYYYGAFAYNEDGVVSEGAIVSVTPMENKPLGEYAEGSIITITEDGAPVEFWVTKQNYEQVLNGAGRVLCVRKNANNQMEYAESYNHYDISKINTWLNNTYKKKFTSAVQTLMGTTTFYVKDGTFTASVFIPSLTEFGRYHEWADVIGAPLPIADTLAVSTTDESGQTVNKWTRTDSNYGSAYAFLVDSVGQSSNSKVSSSWYTLPCITLPATSLVDSNNALVELS